MSARLKSIFSGLVVYGTAYGAIAAGAVITGHGVWGLAQFPSEPRPCSLVECTKTAGRYNLVRITDTTYACDEAVTWRRGRRTHRTIAPLAREDGRRGTVVAVFSGERPVCRHEASKGRPEGVLDRASPDHHRQARKFGLWSRRGYSLTTWAGRGEKVIQIGIGLFVGLPFVLMISPRRRRAGANRRESAATRRMRARADEAALGPIRHEYGFARGEDRAAVIGAVVCLLLVAAGIWMVATAVPDTSDRGAGLFVLIPGAGAFVFFLARMFRIATPRLHLHEHGFVWARGRRCIAARWADVSGMDLTWAQVKAGAGVKVPQHHVHIRLRDGRTVYLNESIDRVTEAAEAIHTQAAPFLDAQPSREEGTRRGPCPPLEDACS